MVRFIARKYAAATSTKNFVAMFCTNVFPNRAKSEENGGKILFSPSLILCSFHCKIFIRLTKTQQYYLTILYTSVGKTPSITATIFMFKSFYCNMFRLIYNKLASGWQGTKEDYHAEHLIPFYTMRVYGWDLTLQYH